MLKPVFLTLRPDRAMGSFRKNDNKDGPVTWSSVGTESLIQEVAKWGEEGKLAILADKSFSSARSKLVAQLKSLDIHWFEHEAIDLRRAERLLAQGVGLESGGLRAIPDLGKAHRVLSLDSDFLGSREPYSLANTRSFMGGRKVSSPSDAKKMNRLYSVESDMTITGESPTTAVALILHNSRHSPSYSQPNYYLLANPTNPSLLASKSWASPPKFIAIGSKPALRIFAPSLLNL